MKNDVSNIAINVNKLEKNITSFHQNLRVREETVFRFIASNLPQRNGFHLQIASDMAEAASQDAQTALVNKVGGGK